ncbi:MAG TPA: hypothetical protein PLS43_08520, partial [Syntrophales bacterium]|nr:hypothetical protein [Syntrophales bacterium]
PLYETWSFSPFMVEIVPVIEGFILNWRGAVGDDGGWLSVKRDDDGPFALVDPADAEHPESVLRLHMALIDSLSIFAVAGLSTGFCFRHLP